MWVLTFKACLSPLYLTGGKYTPLLVKADFYTYSDAEGSSSSRFLTSFTRHLVEKDLVNLEILFW